MSNELREAAQQIDKLREAFDAALARAPSFHEDFQQHRAWAEAFAWFVVRDTCHALTATTSEAAAQAEGWANKQIERATVEEMAAALSTQPVQAQGALDASRASMPVGRADVDPGYKAWEHAPAVDRGLSEAQALRVKSMIVGMTLNVSTEARAKFADELLNLLGLPR